MAPAIFRPIARAVNKAIEMCCVSCPTGSTTDENGIISRFDITVCFCDTPDDRSENPYESGVTITVNGTPWTVDSAQPKAGTDCVTFTGLEPLSYGDVILFNFDYSASTWVSPTEDIVNLVITNYIGAPVQLLNLPSFNAVTGRLDPGDFYNTRTATNLTIINSDGYVETIKNARLAYEGSRVVQNLIGSSNDLTNTSHWTTSNGLTVSKVTDATAEAGFVSQIDFGSDPTGRVYQTGTPAITSLAMRVMVKAASVSSTTFRVRLGGTYTVLTATDEWQDLTVLNTASIDGYLMFYNNAAGNSDDVLVKHIQLENISPKSVQDAPGEYESVGVRVGDEHITNGTFDIGSDGWTLNSPWAWSSANGGEIQGNGGSNKAAYTNDYPVKAIGRSHIVTFTVRNRTTGTLRFYIGNGAQLIANDSGVNGTRSYIFTATTSHRLQIMADGGFDGAIDDISLKEVTGGYGIYNRANGNSVDANGVVTDTPGAVLATAPVLRHAPAATNYADGDDDLSGGPETINLSSLTGNFTLSVYGTAAVTVAAGTATGTGFGQATEGNDITFNLSVTGTITLTLDSGTLDTYQGAAMKQVEQGTASTPFIKTSGAPASRTIDQILHPYSASVLDPDEGTLYFEVVWDRATTAFAGLAFHFLLGLDDVFGGSGRILYNYQWSNKVATYDGTTLVDRTFVTANAGVTVKYVVRWSKSANTFTLGVNPNGIWIWATPQTFVGYTATDFIGLLTNCPAVAKVSDMQVLDYYLIQADAEARWP